MHLPRKGKFREVILTYVYNITVFNNFNRTKASAELGINVRTLRTYLRILRERGEYVPQCKSDMKNTCLMSNEERLKLLDNPKGVSYRR